MGEGVTERVGNEREAGRQMKGVVVVGVVKYLRLWSRRQPGRALRLSEAAHQLLEGTPIVPSGWYDYEAYLELMRAVHEEVFRGRDDALIGFVTAGVPDVYQGPHRHLVRTGEPDRTLRDLEALWSTCHSFGKPRADVGTTDATVCFAGVDGMTRLEGLVNAGWVGGVIEFAGARDLQWEWLTEPWYGAPDLKVAYRWR